MHVSSVSQRGQSLIEILFAVAIFTIGFITIGYLFIDAEGSLVRNIEFTEARFLAHEGIEAVRLIRDYEYTEVTAGTHGLIFEDNRWRFDSASDSTSKFVRSIHVSERDSGIKEIVSTVAWRDSHGSERDVTLQTLITDWRDVQGDAGNLQVDVGHAALSETTEALTMIDIENTGPQPIIITHMVLSWDNFNTLHQITIDGTDVFMEPIPSTNGIVSGASVDITDYTLGAFEGIKTINPITFNGSMYGTDFLLTFVLQDGSKSTVRIDF